jgi:hypothetical protein
VRLFYSWFSLPHSFFSVNKASPKTSSDVFGLAEKNLFFSVSCLDFKIRNCCGNSTGTSYHTGAIPAPIPKVGQVHGGVGGPEPGP